MANSPNWRAVNPAAIATTCSPRHIQSVIEDAQRDIVRVEAERDALRALLSGVEDCATCAHRDSPGGKGPCKSCTHLWSPENGGAADNWTAVPAGAAPTQEAEL